MFSFWFTFFFMTLGYVLGVAAGYDWGRNAELLKRPEPPWLRWLR